MSWTYSCPKCGANLNPDRAIILIGSHEDQRVLIGFNPQPGNYEIYVPPGVEVPQASRWEFFCPVCQASLVSEDDDRLCALEIGQEGARRRVLFSRIAGEQVTFVVGVRDRRIEQIYGADADEYTRHLVHLKYVL